MEREFQVVQGLNWPADICKAWQTLMDDDPKASYVQTYYWNKACIEQLGVAPNGPILVIAWRGTKLEAVFPFVLDVQRLFGVRSTVVRLPQHPHINLHDVALSSDSSHEDLITDLFGFLSAQQGYACDVIDFGNVSENSAIFELLRTTPGTPITVIPRRVANYIPVMSEDQLRKHVSKNMRASLRKAQKKLARYADVRFLTTRDSLCLPEFFERFLDVEASGWKGKKGMGTAILLDAKLVAFYRQLLETFGEDGKCEISLLETDGQVAAAQFALIVGQSMYLLKIGYDQGMAEIAPGNLLLAHTLSRLHAQGEVAYVNLITDVDWHSRWRPQQQAVYEARCFGQSPRGKLAYLHQRVRIESGKWGRSLKAMAGRRSV